MASSRRNGLGSRARLVAAAALLMVTVAGLGNTADAAATAGTRILADRALPPAPLPGLSRNRDVEPSVATDGSGEVWAIGNVNAAATDDPRNDITVAGEGASRQADIWRSTDGGRSYAWVAAPFGRTGSSRLAYDVDITAAKVANSAGYYNVYAVNATGDAALAFSTDGGRNWTTIPLSSVALDDRPWVAAAGACSFYLSYWQVPTQLTIVNRYDVCSYSDAGIGAPFAPSTSAPVPDVDGFAQLPAGRVVVAPVARPNQADRIYLPLELCKVAGPDEALPNPLAPPCPHGVLYAVSSSDDGGRTWSRPQTVGTGQIPTPSPSAAVDSHGRVYLTWYQSGSIRLAYSNDGRSWSHSTQVSGGSARTSVLPMIASGPAGSIAVAWYATTANGDPESSQMRGAEWRVYVARSLDGGRHFRSAAVTGIVHTGRVCLQPGCSSADPQAGNLWDNLGVALSPDGRTLVVYTSAARDENPAADTCRYVTVG